MRVNDCIFRKSNILYDKAFDIFGEKCSIEKVRNMEIKQNKKVPSLIKNARWYGGIIE
jgi:hypothetical protein